MIFNKTSVPLERLRSACTTDNENIRKLPMDV